MNQSCRPCWCNCSLYADEEILAIDELEDAIAPVRQNVERIRHLISTLEICHHKAGRWIENIIESIGKEETEKGLGSRPPGAQHPVECVWENACAALAMWCSGCPAWDIDMVVGEIPASELLGGLGYRSPLKEWQVQRVIEKIRSSIHFPQSMEYPSAQYRWILLGGGDYDATYRRECPGYFIEHEEFWLITVRTMICDTVDGEPAELSLGLAIDMLMPCHWQFVGNLRIVLEAIGGKLQARQPFMACGRNISLTPARCRLEIICSTLRAFWKGLKSDAEVDRALLVKLGNPTEAKRWLSASLEKTIRLQLDPPEGLRQISAMSGPEWIKR